MLFCFSINFEPDIYFRFDGVGGLKELIILLGITKLQDVKHAISYIQKVFNFILRCVGYCNELFIGVFEFKAGAQLIKLYLFFLLGT